MLELPRHHVPRSTLLERVASAPVVVIEAGSGFGKSTFAAEIAGAGGASRRIYVALTEQDAGPHGLLVPLRRALDRAGAAEAATALAAPTGGTGDAIAAMADALTETGAGGRGHAATSTLVIDDAHHLADGGATLVQLVASRPPGLRLVIGARTLPTEASSLRHRPDVEVVDAAALRFDGPQTSTLLRDGFQLDADDATVTELVAATDGWPAGLAVVAERWSRDAADSDTALAGVTATRLVDRFTSVLLRSVPAEHREVVGQLAQLPWLDHDLADAAADRSDILDDVLAAGLPLVADDEGRLRFPGAVADALRRSPLDAQAATRAADHLTSRGLVFDACAVLRRAGDHERIADLLVDLPPAARAQLTADEVVAIVDPLPPAFRRSRPDLLVELARALSRLGQLREHRDVLDEAARALAAGPLDAAAPGTAVVRRAIESERVSHAIYTDDQATVAARARALLDEVGAEEARTTGRALLTLGVLGAWRGAREEASRLLRRASSVLVEVGEPYEASRALVQLGFNVDLHGDLRVAERTFAEAVDLAGTDGRARATALTYLGEVKVWRGRPDEGVGDLERAAALARAVRDARAQAYAAWGLALHASILGDTERTVVRVREAGRHLESWMDTGVGATYLATMVDLLDRAGATAEADAFLAEVRPRRDEQPELVTLAEFVVAARRGDPAEAERLWPAIEADEGIELFERVRCRLLRAYAALRRGDPETGRRLREAVAEAETQGLTGVPSHLEPVAAAALETWQAAQEGSYEITCLGGFEVRRGQQVVPLPPGRPTELVVLLALEPGPQRLQRVLETLWPHTPDRDARVRLRQVLYRLRRAAPELVVRPSDEILALAPDVRLDLATFDRRWSAAADVPDDRDAALRAIELPGDEVLTGFASERLDADVALVRQNVHDRRLALLDRLARLDADARPESSLRWAEQAHGLDPSDDRRAVALAGQLLERGRAADARRVCARTTAALTDLGVPLGRPLRELNRRLGVTERVAPGLAGTAEA